MNVILTTKLYKKYNSIDNKMRKRRYGVEKIVIGKKEIGKDYGFRETCFGIVVKDNMLYCTKKGEDLSLIGGGIEHGEDHIDCLKREFKEEAGLTIISAEPLCTIDCFWLTKTNKDMESLTNIYVCRVAEHVNEPTEEESKLQIVDINNAINLLPLPYQKKAIEEYQNRYSY